MRKLIAAFLLTISLASCGDKTVEKVTKVFPDGTPEVISIYSPDEEELLGRKKFHQNGNLSIEGSYLNGEKDGTWTSYYSNGSIWTINNYKMGKYHGDYKMLNKDGSPRIIGHYTDGEESGHWTFYGDDGSVVKEENY